MGGDSNAFTTKECTTFYVRLLSEHLPLGLDILSEIMWNPACVPPTWTPSARHTRRDLMHADEPADLVAEQWQSSLFPGHALGTRHARHAVHGGRSGCGGHTPLSNTITAPATWWSRWRGTARTTAWRPTSNGALPVKREGPLRPHRTGPDTERLHVVRRPTEQAHVVYGVRSVSRYDERRFALSVLNHVLGGGLSSRLFQKVREERGLAYSVWSERATYEMPARWPSSSAPRRTTSTRCCGS